jgi:hypothetical protein
VLTPRFLRSITSTNFNHLHFLDSAGRWSHWTPTWSHHAVYPTFAARGSRLEQPERCIPECFDASRFLSSAGCGPCSSARTGAYGGCVVINDRSPVLESCLALIFRCLPCSHLSHLPCSHLSFLPSFSVKPSSCCPYQEHQEGKHRLSLQKHLSLLVVPLE